MTEVNIEELADKTVADVKAGRLVISGVQNVKEAVKAASGFLGKLVAGAKAVGKLIYSTVKYAEQLGKDMGLAGSQKRELAVQVINKLIDLPWLNESMEAIVIGFAVDAVVTAFNEHLGHAWIQVKAALNS